MSQETIITDWKDKGTELAVARANTRIWRHGQGETVVCLHGVPSSAFLYRKLLPELSLKGLEGVAFDFPGLGFADRPGDFDYSWSGMSKWTVAAIDAAEIDHFHLVVHDIGGPIGFDVIQRIPDRIRSLTVLNTMIRVATFHRPWVMAPFAYRGVGWLWLQSMRTPIILMLMRMIGVCDKPTNEELWAYAALLFREDGGASFLKIMRSFERTKEFESRIVDALENRNFPAQVIWGKQDPVLRVANYAPELCRILRLDEFNEVPGKHFLQEDSPKEIAAYVARLIAESGPADRASKNAGN